MNIESWRYSKDLEISGGRGMLKRLELPESHNLLYAIAFGYPDESPAAKPRKAEKIRFVD